MMRSFLAPALGTLLAGCQCRVDPSVPTPSASPTPTARPTADTGPLPACAVEESEPNNALDDADRVPLEADACGSFQERDDGDRWRFELPRDEWVSVTVRAREDGSLANPQLFLVGDDRVLERVDGDDSADPFVHVPLTAGTYDLQLRDQNGGGDADGRWFYDLQVSVQKAPTDWDAVEVEPNADALDATPVSVGTAVFGILDPPGDTDLYAVPLVPGRQALTLSVEAFGLGSPADTRLVLERGDGSPPDCGAAFPDCSFSRGEIGYESDPWVSWTTESEGTLYVRVRAESGLQGSPAHWYVLRVERS